MGSEGRRLPALKFVESVVLLYTPDPNGTLEPPSDQISEGTSGCIDADCIHKHTHMIYLCIYTCVCVCASLCVWACITCVYFIYELLTFLQGSLMNSMSHGFVVDIPYSMLEICQLKQAKVWVFCLIS